MVVPPASLVRPVVNDKSTEVFELILHIPPIRKVMELVALLGDTEPLTLDANWLASATDQLSES